MRTYIKQMYNFGIVNLVNYNPSLVHLFSTSAQTVHFSSCEGTGMNWVYLVAWQNFLFQLIFIFWILSILFLSFWNPLLLEISNLVFLVIDQRTSKWEVLKSQTPKSLWEFLNSNQNGFIHERFDEVLANTFSSWKLNPSAFLKI